MGLIPDSIVRQVIERTDIVEMIAGYFPLKRAGRNYKANCPFHQEKTPSFMVNPAKQIFHCFGCGTGGNVLSFVMKYERLEFPEAVRLLAEKANIVIPEESNPDRKNGEDFHKIFEINALALDFFHQTLLFDRSAPVEEARAYLKSRQVSLETVKRLKIGYAPESWDAVLNMLSSKGVAPSMTAKAGLAVPRNQGNGFYDRFRNRIMFPIIDARGQCRAFGGRTMNNDPAKYLNSPETPVYVKGQHLFGLNQAKQEILNTDRAVIVEGYMDCVIPHQFGFTNVVASLGTALTSEQIRLLARYTKNIVLLFDADAAGESAAMRSLDLLVDEGINIRMATLAEGEDPDSFLRKYGADAFRQRLEAAENVFDYKFNRLLSRYGMSDPESRSCIVREILPTLQRLNDEVLRAGYIKQLGERLHVSEEAIRLEAKKILQTPVWEKSSAPVVSAPPAVTVKGAEWQILKLMLEDAAWVEAVQQSVIADDFQHGAGRDIARMILERHQRKDTIHPGVLLESCSGERVREYLTALLVDDESATGDRQKLFQDCVQRLKSDRIKSRRQELLKAISQAEQKGDWPVLKELQQEFSQLTKCS